MMKSMFAVLLPLFFSCSSPKNGYVYNNCIENANFKKAFFSNIENIENNISINQNESFKKSLRFLSKYVHVSYESTLNYANVYTTDAFKTDSEEWLKWYEENKCNNIKIKK